MSFYRKKPVIIEAIEWNGNNLKEIINFAGDKLIIDYNNKPGIFIDTLEGSMKVSINDYIIKGVNGEFYPCKPDIFEKTYERVEDKENES